MSDLVAAAGIDQSNVSRRISKLQESDLVRVGRGRRAQYALRRSISGLEDTLSIRRWSELGQISVFGRLEPIHQNGCFVDVLEEGYWHSIFSDEFIDGAFPEGGGKGQSKEGGGKGQSKIS